MNTDLHKKVQEMSLYLEDDAIAAVLKITPEMVRDIRDGTAEIREIPSSKNHYAPVVQVGSVKTAYRQKVISVFRVKGGVGNTILSICLAYSLSREVSTLLFDLNFSLGGSDAAYYLGLPPYSDQFSTIEVEPNFHVIQSSDADIAKIPELPEIIRAARNDYDAIVIDLPNVIQKWVGDVLSTSTSIIALTSGLELETARLESILVGYRNKDILVVLSPLVKTKDTPKDYPIVELPHDPSIGKSFLNGEMPSEKTMYMKNMAKIKDLIFQREKRSVLDTLFGRL